LVVPIDRGERLGSTLLAAAAIAAEDAAAAAAFAVGATVVPKLSASTSFDFRPLLRAVFRASCAVSSCRKAEPRSNASSRKLPTFMATRQGDEKEFGDRGG
jgi:hypothetical protein